ncbi:MAG: cell division protein SepF [Lachnospiraceae bacterium]|nr:cell division protein SepF [Lachnospiraceae bacterium]
MGVGKKFLTWLNGEDDEDEDLEDEFDDDAEYEDDEEDGEHKPSIFARLKARFLPNKANDEEEDDDEASAEEVAQKEPAKSNLASRNTLLTASAYRDVQRSETGYANTVNRQAAASTQFSHATTQPAYQQQSTTFRPAVPQSAASTQPAYPQKTPLAPTKERTASLNPTANVPQKQFSVMKPTSFEDSSSIVDVLRNGKAIIVNFEGSNPGLSQRIMDFVCGCIYTIDGQILQISGYIFIVAPKDMDITGDYTAFLQQDSFGVPTFRQ